MGKNHSDNRRIFRGISLSWIKFLVTLVIGIFQTPLLFKHLPQADLNTWYVFFSFGTFLQISDLGLVSSISRIIAYKENAQEGAADASVEKFRGYHNRQIYLTAILSFLSILVVAATIIYLPYHSMHRSTGFSETAFLLFLGGTLFSLLSNMPSAMLSGFRDMGYDNLVKSILQVFFFAALFILLPRFQSVLFVSAAFFIQYLLQFFILHLILYKRHPHLTEAVIRRKELIRLSIVKHIYSQSFPLAVNQLGTWLTTQGSVLIALTVLGPDKISEYVVNQQLFTYAIGISLVVNQNVGPFIARHYIQKNMAALVQYFKNTAIACMAIVCFFLTVLLICIPNLMGIWIGQQHFLGYHFAIVFALITFFEVQHSVAGNFVWYMGKWPFNAWTFAAGILNILLGYFFGMAWGLFGIALATLVSKLVTLNWYVVYYCLKKIGITLREYASTVLLPMISAVGISLVIVSFFKQEYTMSGLTKWTNLIVLSGVSSIVFLLSAILFFRKSFRMLFLLFK